MEKRLSDVCDRSADLLVGFPASLTRSTIEQIVGGLLAEVTLTLENIKVHKDGDVKIKVPIVGRRRVGRYSLDIHLDRIEGALRPGKPKLSFEDDRIAIELPISVIESGAVATLRFQWDGKGVAQPVCGDLDVTREVSGRTIPASYALAGSFRLAVDGGELVGVPALADTPLRFRIEASQQAWKVVDEIVADRGRLCRKALETVDIKKVLGGLLRKGFDVKLPRDLLPPIRFPASIGQSVSIDGTSYELKLIHAGLAVTPERLWYGVDLEAEKTEVGSPATP